jgi:small subunit ribosomal protein S17
MTKKQLKGIVVSDKMQKTVVVRVESLKTHPRYHKTYRIHKRYKAHDEKQECKVGDGVIIEECRPLSKDKRWKIKNVLSKGEPASEAQA